MHYDHLPVDGPAGVKMATCVLYNNETVFHKQRRCIARRNRTGVAKSNFCCRRLQIPLLRLNFHQLRWTSADLKNSGCLGVGEDGRPLKKPVPVFYLRLWPPSPGLLSQPVLL